MFPSALLLTLTLQIQANDAFVNFMGSQNKLALSLPVAGVANGVTFKAQPLYLNGVVSRASRSGMQDFLAVFRFRVLQ